MTEHFTFQQLLAERRTVNRYKILPCTLTTVMDGLGKYLLTRARFSQSTVQEHQSLTPSELMKRHPSELWILPG